MMVRVSPCSILLLATLMLVAVVSAAAADEDAGEPFLLIGNTCRGDCDSSILKYDLTSGSMSVFIDGGVLSGM